MQAANASHDEIEDAELKRMVERAHRREARGLYWRGWTLKQISDELGVKYPTVHAWKRRENWDDVAPTAVIEDRLELKIATLIDKEPFTEGDMKRVDFLTRQMERLARIKKYEATGKEGDLNPKIAARNDDKAKAKRADKRKNFLTLEQWQALLDDFHAQNFEYQAAWWEQREQRERKIRKSRQVGATWYFAKEAMAKIAEAVLAAEQPRNQIFLSASERQALKFRRIIVPWVRKVTGVELTGKFIELVFDGLYPGDEEAGLEPVALDSVALYFLSTNSATAQGESGDFYFDEYAWVHGFAELKKVASAMATHKIYKKTYFSTPSTKTHASFAMWSGEEWNKGRRKGNQRPFDVSKRNLRKGAIMPDGSWQQILDIHDAVAGGLGKLVDVDELRREYSEDEFRNLFECEDVDDAESSFPFSLIAPCGVDSFDKWRDFEPAKAHISLIDMPHQRPFGDKPVWLGYDPNNQGRDDAALVVVAPPEKAGGTFRLLAKYRLNNLDYQQQADFIEKIAAKFNVVDIGIDASGIGGSVAMLVKKWFPTLREIQYSVATKTALVLKGQNVFRNGRIEFDKSWTDVMSALIAIRPALTGSQKGVTYVARRNGQIGHADVAWALLHALSNEPMDAGTVHAGGGGFAMEF